MTNQATSGLSFNRVSVKISYLILITPFFLLSWELETEVNSN